MSIAPTDYRAPQDPSERARTQDWLRARHETANAKRAPWNGFGVPAIGQRVNRELLSNFAWDVLGTGDLLEDPRAFVVVRAEGGAVIAWLHNDEGLLAELSARGGVPAGTQVYALTWDAIATGRVELRTGVTRIYIEGGVVVGLVNAGADNS